MEILKGINYHFREKSQATYKMKYLKGILKELSKPILRIGEKEFSIVDVKDGEVKSIMYNIILTLQNKYGVNKDLTSRIDSYVMSYVDMP